MGMPDKCHILGTKWGGVRNWSNFADVHYGWPLKAIIYRYGEGWRQGANICSNFTVVLYGCLTVMALFLHAVWYVHSWNNFCDDILH